MDISRTYQITLIGESSLLMHHDNLKWQEAIDAYRMAPENKKSGIAGDDRSPAWSWIGYLYVDADRIVIPADNLMKMLSEGGNNCPTGSKQGKKTFKAMTQSGILVDQIAWPVEVDGKTILFSEIKKLESEKDFVKHEALAKKLGFELFVKRAKIGQAKHVRVRPRFAKGWVAAGTVTVFEQKITTEVLKNILTYAGRYQGMLDWRPGSPKSPGNFGKFRAEVMEVE